MKLKDLIKGDKNRKAGIYILLLAGILLLGFGSLPKKQSESEPSTEQQSDAASASEYVDALERRLEKTLAQIDGAGRVSVMLVAQNAGSLDVGRDGSGENGKTVVLSRQNGGEALVLAQNMPSVAGAVIVAEGAGNDRVKAELAEAAATALGVGAHRVKVCKMGRNSAINEGD